MERPSDRLAPPTLDPEVPRPVTTPPEPRSRGPRLRARAKAGPSDALRPEVTAALAGLERSIGVVAAVEQGLADAPADAPATAAPGRSRPAPEAGDLVLGARVTRPPHAGTTGGVADPGSVPPVAAPVEAGGLELGLATAVAPRVADEAPAPDLDLGPLLARSGDEDDEAAAWAVLPAAAGWRHPGDRKARRRRNGRILSWAGAGLLVGLAAWLLLPSSSSTKTTDQTTTTDRSTTTAVTAGSIDGPVFTTPTSAAAPVVTTPDTVAPSAGTTVTTPRRRTTGATSAPVVTAPPPTSPPPTAPPPTQPPPPPTTTTQPPPPTTTTTFCAIGGVPDPAHGTC